MKNRFGLPKELKRKVVAVLDNGGETLDRYTVYYGNKIFPANWGCHVCVGMNSAPFHPQGIGMHGEGRLGKHNGKAIQFKDLPEDCKKLVYQDLDLEYTK